LALGDFLKRDFIITQITFVVIIYFAKQYCHFVQGSGIPQLIAATDSRNKSIREQLLILASVSNT
jgi:H+/Cl- antiporter ClcA